jgi:hypothetical protein
MKNKKPYYLINNLIIYNLKCVKIFNLFNLNFIKIN